MSCTLFKLYLEILNGQAVEKTPKWTGVFGISEALNDIQATFEQIVQDKDEIFSGKNTFENNKLDFQNTLISSEYTTEVDALVIKYEKDGVNQTHKPLYVENYSPVETNDTSLYLINQEFETVIEEAEKLLNDSNTKADSIVSSSDTMKSSIDSINNIIVDFNTTLSDFSTSVAEPWMDYQELITKYGSLACNCFFGILAGFGVAVIVLTLLFVFLKIRLVKIFVIIIWNVLALVMIFSFIIGGIFGLLGVIGKDGTSVVHFLISEDNLESDATKLIPGSISKKLDICLHGTGDLSSKFNTTGIEDLSELDKIKTDLEIARANLLLHKNSETIKRINTILENANLNYVNEDFSDFILGLNEETNKGKSCFSSSVYDLWVNKKEDCVAPNIYSETRGQLGNKNCLVFDDKEQDKARYSSCSFASGVEKYLDSIHSFKSTNSHCITALKAKNAKLNTKFTGVVNQLLETIDEVDKKLLQKVRNLTNSINGKEEGNIISTLVNCAFLSGHIRMLYKNLYEGLGANFYSFGVIMEVISSSIALGICFIIAVYNRYNKIYPEDKKLSSEEDKSPLKLYNSKEAAPSTGAFADTEVINVSKPVKSQQKCLEKGKIISKKVN